MSDQQMMNPYSAPSTPLDAIAGAAGLPLATRAARFGAQFLDGIVMGVPTLLLIVLAMPAGDRPIAAILTALAFLYFIAISVYQWIRLSRTGQTIGKKWAGVRVVRIDGQPIDFGAAVGMRLLLPGLLGIVPGFSLVDILFIFRGDRRCIHDLIAGTRVVQA